MKRTFIKRNSQTQREARKTADTVDLICYRACISREDWLTILFETGWQWAERNVQSDKIRKVYLEDITKGFWAWWLCEMVEDDKSILERNVPLYGGRYEDLKFESIYASSKNQDQA